MREKWRLRGVNKEGGMRPQGSEPAGRCGGPGQ